MITLSCGSRVVLFATRDAPATRQRPGAGRLVGVDVPEGTCSVSECKNQVRALGMCKNHYEKQRRVTAGPVRKRPPRVDDLTRFMAKTRELPNGCLEWIGALDKGYGAFGVPRPDKPSVFTTIRAHRWLWQYENGPLPRNIDLDHYRWPQDGCIGRACVRHVRPATRRENLLRGDTIAAKYLARSKCDHGHVFSADNVYIRADGTRGCRICNAAQCAKRYARAKSNGVST